MTNRHVNHNNNESGHPHQDADQNQHQNRGRRQVHTQEHEQNHDPSQNQEHEKNHDPSQNQQHEQKHGPSHNQVHEQKQGPSHNQVHEQKHGPSHNQVHEQKQHPSQKQEHNENRTDSKDTSRPQLESAGRIEPWLGRSFVCESCGQEHRVPLRAVVLERGALAALPPYARSRGLRDLLLVCDRRTAAAAESLLELCAKAQLQAQLFVLADDEHGELAADERAIVQLLLHVAPATQAIVAVGAGTLHDIVRFAAHRTGRVYLSVPTAPSVDGFASVGAPLILGGFKQTVPACAPEAIFGDLAVLTEAPRPMIAAGFGDMLGKYTSLADWELGRVLLDEPMCELAAAMTRQGLELCIRHTEAIAAGTEEGVRRLMEGLILSGISMLIVGHSRPASGGEHHLSHYWEMKFLQAGRKALLHGAKVGVAAVKMAALYRDAASFDAASVRQAASQRLADAAFASPDATGAAIRTGYGAIAGQVLAENAAELDPARRMAQLQQLAGRLGSRWDAVQAICRSVPAPEQLAEWLAAAGGPVSAEQLGLEPELVEDSLRYAKYVRSRYTILRLREWI